MNVKKIIKGIIGLGAIGGVAYAAYKLGEKNGEVNERFRQKYDEDDDDFEFYDGEDDDEDDEPSDEEDEPPDNYYGTCFEPKYDEPDDGCIAPAEKQCDEPNEDFDMSEYDKNITVGYDENCDNGDHYYIRLRGLDTLDIPMSAVFRALAAVKDSYWVTNKDLRKKAGCSYDTAERILMIFEDAGYISEKNRRCRHKVYIHNMSLKNLI